MTKYQIWLLEKVGDKTNEVRTLDIRAEDLGLEKPRTSFKKVQELFYLNFPQGGARLPVYQVGEERLPWIASKELAVLAAYYHLQGRPIPCDVYVWPNWEAVEQVFKVRTGVDPRTFYEKQVLPLRKKLLKMTEGRRVQLEDFIRISEARLDFSSEESHPRGVRQFLTQTSYSFFQAVEELLKNNYEAGSIFDIDSAPQFRVYRLVGHTGVSKSATVEDIPTQYSVEINLKYYGYEKDGNPEDLIIHLPPRVSVVKAGQFDPTDFGGMVMEFPKEAFQAYIGKALEKKPPSVESPLDLGGFYVSAPVSELWTNSDQAVFQARVLLAQMLSSGDIELSEGSWEGVKKDYTEFTHFRITPKGQEAGLTREILDSLVYYARPVIFFLDEFSRSFREATYIWMTILSIRKYGTMTFYRTFFVVADNDLGPREEKLRTVYETLYPGVSREITGASDMAILERFQNIYVDFREKDLQDSVIDYLSRKFSDLPQVRDFLRMIQDLGFLYALPRPITLAEKEKGEGAAAEKAMEKFLKDPDDYAGVPLEEKYPTFRAWEFVLEYLSEVYKRGKPVRMEVLESILGDLDRMALPEYRHNRFFSDLKGTQTWPALRLGQALEVYLQGGQYKSPEFQVTFQRKYKISEVDKSAYTDLLKDLAVARVPVLVMGRPGVAKSAIAKALARELNRGALSPQDDPEDYVYIVNLTAEERSLVRGAPFPSPIWGEVSYLQDKVEQIRKRGISFSYPVVAAGRPEVNFLKRINQLRSNPNAYLVLVFDEINRAHPLQQAVVLDAISNHKLYGVDFTDVADRVVIMATANAVRPIPGKEDTYDLTSMLYSGTKPMDHAVFARYAILWVEDIDKELFRQLADYWINTSLRKKSPAGQYLGMDHPVFDEIFQMTLEKESEFLRAFNEDISKYAETRQDEKNAHLQYLSPRTVDAYVKELATEQYPALFTPSAGVGTFRFGNRTLKLGDAEDLVEAMRILSVAVDSRIHVRIASSRSVQERLRRWYQAYERDVDLQKKGYRIPPLNAQGKFFLAALAANLVSLYEQAKEKKEEALLKDLEEDFRKLLEYILDMEDVIPKRVIKTQNIDPVFEEWVEPKLETIWQCRPGGSGVFLADWLQTIHQKISEAYREKVQKALKGLDEVKEEQEVYELQEEEVRPLIWTYIDRLVRDESVEGYFEGDVRKISGRDYLTLLSLIYDLGWISRGEDWEATVKNREAIKEFVSLVNAAASSALSSTLIPNYDPGEPAKIEVDLRFTQKVKRDLVGFEAMILSQSRLFGSDTSETSYDPDAFLQHMTGWILGRLWANGIWAEYESAWMSWQELASSGVHMIIAPNMPGGVFVDDPAWYQVVSKEAIYGIPKEDGEEVDHHDLPYMPPTLFWIRPSGVGSLLPSAHVDKPTFRLAVVRTPNIGKWATQSVYVDLFEIPMGVKKADYDFSTKTEKRKDAAIQTQKSTVDIEWENGDRWVIHTELQMETVMKGGKPDAPILLDYEDRIDAPGSRYLVLSANQAPFYKQDFKGKAQLKYITAFTKLAQAEGKEDKLLELKRTFTEEKTKIVDGFFSDVLKIVKETDAEAAFAQTQSFLRKPQIKKVVVPSWDLFLRRAGALLGIKR